MSCCVPSCGVPVCAPSGSPPVCYPAGGLGSLTSCGSYGSASSGGVVSAASLGIMPGANVGCICQTPPSEIIIQPSPCCVTIPGAMLCATCEPVRVGGHTACAVGSSSGGGSRLRYYPCGPCGPCK